MFKQTIKPMTTSAPKSSPNPGSVSSVGPSGAAPKPRGLKNTRDYGKSAPSSMPMAPPQSAPSPFGPTEGGSRIGGI
jgi:hypothetical protein